MSNVFNPSEDAINAMLEIIDKSTKSPMYCSGSWLARIGNGMVVKFGWRVSQNEAQAMEYVRTHTTIPIPKVHMVFVHGEDTYIVMDLVEGEILAEAHLSTDTVRSLAIQLSQYIAQLRRLDSVPPHTTMGAWPSGPYRNAIFRRGLMLEREPAREFLFIEQFHSFWLESLPLYYRVRHLNLMRLGQNYPIVLTHGDLSLSNIMVKDGKITGIIDWEMFGWYPDFWEIVAIVRHNGVVENWVEEIGAAIGGRPKVVDEYLAIFADRAVS